MDKKIPWRGKKKESERPGSSTWHDNESNVNPSSGSVDAKKNSKLPFSLFSKVPFKEDPETTHDSSAGSGEQPRVIGL